MVKELEGCQYIGKHIAMIHRANVAYLSKEFNKFDIGSGQYMFLLALYKNEGITQEQLTEMLKLDKATTARAIKKLEDEGYVERIKKETDKRVYDLILTEKAQLIKEEVYSIMNKLNSRLNDCFTDEETQELIRLLNKLINSSLFK